MGVGPRYRPYLPKYWTDRHEIWNICVKVTGLSDEILIFMAVCPPLSSEVAWSQMPAHEAVIGEDSS